MRFLIEALPFRALLTMLWTVPMAAAIAFGGAVSFEAFDDYNKLWNAVTLERLATSAGKVLLSTSIEGSTTPVRGFMSSQS